MATWRTPVGSARTALGAEPSEGPAKPAVVRCEASGRVDLDGLDRRERLEYLCAKAGSGPDAVAPCVAGRPRSEP